MSTQATEKEAAIELIVEQDKEGQVAATVPVRWKISEETIEKLAKEGAEKPYLLLVVTAGTTELDRRVIPLIDGMTYLQLHRPGINTIHATIVWRMEGEDDVKTIITKTYDDGVYLCDLVRSGESVGLRDHFYRFYRIREEDQINVEVPEAMFAAEPPRWMKWLGTRYPWLRTARDQCDLRRRALFTVFSLPFVVALAIVVGVVLLVEKLLTVIFTGVLLFFGVRGINYSAIVQLDSTPFGVFPYCHKPSFWWHKKVTHEVQHPDRNGEPYTRQVVEYVPRDVAFVFINPPAVVFSIAAQLLISASFVQAVTIGSLMFVVFGLITSATFRLLGKRDDRKSKSGIIPDEQKSKLVHDLAPLTARGAATLSSLPAQKRTVQLRYLHLKAAVCKPFVK